MLYIYEPKDQKEKERKKRTLRESKRYIWLVHWAWTRWTRDYTPQNRNMTEFISLSSYWVANTLYKINFSISFDYMADILFREKSSFIGILLIRYIFYSIKKSNFLQSTIEKLSWKNVLMFMNRSVAQAEKSWVQLSSHRVGFERCEQPIDVKPGLKIRANSSVWLDFRGEKSPQKPPLTFKRGGQLSSPPSTDWAPGVNFTEKIPSTLNLRLLELLPVAAS